MNQQSLCSQTAAFTPVKVSRSKTGGMNFSFNAPLLWNHSVWGQEADTKFTTKTRLKTFIFD